MSRIWAIARQTFWEGVRMRIVLVCVIVLGFVVLRLPFALKGDETLAGRLQTFLSYSLAALSLFMSLATAFFSCASLAGEIRSKSLHLVVTKPVTRFQILAGKWLGVNLLNLLIVTLCGAVIYGLALYISNSQSTFERDRVKLRDTIWTARVAANPTPPDFRKLATEFVDNYLKENQTYSKPRDEFIEEKMIEFRAAWLRVPAYGDRVYEFDNLPQPKDTLTAMQVRFKLRAEPLPPGEVAHVAWAFIDPQSKAALTMMDTNERSSEIHQFLVRSGVIRDGRVVLAIATIPPTHRSALMFDTPSDLQVLYPVGSFETNYVKTLALILFRLGFLSAVGVFFSAFVSFPVACFCVLSIYVFCLGMPWWLESIGANLEVRTDQVDPYGKWGPVVRALLVPVFKIALPDFFKYDGVDSLINGYYLSPGLMLRAAAHTLLYGLLILVLPGWLIFRSREIAEVVV